MSLRILAFYYDVNKIQLHGKLLQSLKVSSFYKLRHYKLKNSTYIVITFSGRYHSKDIYGIPRMSQLQHAIRSTRDPHYGRFLLFV